MLQEKKAVGKKVYVVLFISIYTQISVHKTNKCQEFAHSKEKTHIDENIILQKNLTY